MRRIDRREFAKEASLAFLSGVTVTVSACGGGGDYSGSGPTTSTTPPPAGSEEGQISANHGHEAIITAAQLMAGGALQVDIAGTAGHSHIASLPAQAVQDVRDGRPVETVTTIMSAPDPHSHTVTFNAESPDPPMTY